MNNKIKLIVKNTKKYGKGVFAVSKIMSGTRIHTLNGRRMTLNQMINKVLRGKEMINDPLQIGKKTYIDLDKFSRMFNHSCDPNAGIRNRSELFAIRDIYPNEEITYDYSATIAPTKWEMKCKCGSRLCRGVLHDIRSIPARQINAYKSIGALPRYIKPVLKMLESKKYKIPLYEIKALKKLDNVSI